MAESVWKIKKEKKIWNKKESGLIFNRPTSNFEGNKRAQSHQKFYKPRIPKSLTCSVFIFHFSLINPRKDWHNIILSRKGNETPNTTPDLHSISQCVSCFCDPFCFCLAGLHVHFPSLNHHCIGYLGSIHIHMHTYACFTPVWNYDTMLELNLYMGSSNYVVHCVQCFPPFPIWVFSLYIPMYYKELLNLFFFWTNLVPKNAKQTV